MSDVCALCGYGGEDVKPLGAGRGWPGGDAAPSGRFLVTVPGLVVTSKGREFTSARFHAHHQIEVGETTRKEFGLEYFERFITCGTLAFLRGGKK